MFQRLPFPADAVSDIEELISLSDGQLRDLTGMLAAPEAAAPVDPSFIEQVTMALGLDEVLGESIVGTAVLLQRYGFDREAATEVVGDMRLAVKRYASIDQRPSLLDQLDEKAEALVELLIQHPEVSRELRRRSIQAGTQPSIKSIRTLVQLRPLFTEDEDENAVDIDCLIPAMTLELAFEKNGQTQTATFSLNDETLEQLLDQLHRTKAKWQIMHEKYAEHLYE